MKKISILFLMLVCWLLALRLAAQDYVSLFGFQENHLIDRGLLSVVGSVEVSTSSKTKADPAIILNGRSRRLTISDAGRQNVSTITPAGFSGVFLGDGSGLTGVIKATTSYLADGESLALTGDTFSADASSVTLRGNAFNEANQLVLLDGDGKLPAIDGSQLTGITSGVSQLVAGTNITLDPPGGTGAVTINASGGGAGKPDIIFSYTGDIFNSTSTFSNGLSAIIAKAAISIGNYDVFIGSATTDTFEVKIGTRSPGGLWVEVESVTVPAGVSTHTATSAGFAIAEGALVKYDFAGVNNADPAGDIIVRIKE
jgi:hypothetical protein